MLERWWSTWPRPSSRHSGRGNHPAIFAGRRSVSGGADKNADRVFYFNEEPRVKKRIAAKINPRAKRSQTTLETFT
jgi:hypothetical protein